LFTRQAGTYGTPKLRTAEARKSARCWARLLNFLNLTVTPTSKTARPCHQIGGLIRRIRPSVVLAPSVVENQHPDHARLESWCVMPPGWLASAD